MAKFEEGDMVRDVRFNETHRVLNRMKAGGNWYYSVQNVTGPGAYQGEEVWEEADLVKAEGGANANHN